MIFNKQKKAWTIEKLKTIHPHQGDNSIHTTHCWVASTYTQHAVEETTHNTLVSGINLYTTRSWRDYTQHTVEWHQPTHNTLLRGINLHTTHCWVASTYTQHAVEETTHNTLLSGVNLYTTRSWRDYTQNTVEWRQPSLKIAVAPTRRPAPGPEHVRKYCTGQSSDNVNKACARPIHCKSGQ